MKTAEVRPLSTAEIEAKLLQTCEVWREAMEAEEQHAGENDLRQFWHGIAKHHNIRRHALAEVLGLLSGDPANEHYYDRLQTWEKEQFEKADVERIKAALNRIRADNRKMGVLS